MMNRKSITGTQIIIELTCLLYIYKTFNIWVVIGALVLTVILLGIQSQKDVPKSNNTT